MPKKIVKYLALHRCKLGERALVTPVNHPHTANGALAHTSGVLSYDPKTGHFETEGTQYRPAPFAVWPDGADCAPKAPRAVTEPAPLQCCGGPLSSSL